MKFFACLGTCAFLAFAVVGTSDACESCNGSRTRTVGMTKRGQTRGFWGQVHAHWTGCCEATIGCGRHEHQLLDRQCKCRPQLRKDRRNCGCGGHMHAGCRARRSGCNTCGSSRCGGCSAGRGRIHRRHGKSCECAQCIEPMYAPTVKRRSPRGSFTYTPTSGLSDTGVARVCIKKIEGINKCRTTRGCRRRGCGEGCTLCMLNLHDMFPCNKGKCGESGDCDSCGGGEQAEHVEHGVEIHDGSPVPMKDPMAPVPTKEAPKKKSDTPAKKRSI